MPIYQVILIATLVVVCIPWAPKGNLPPFAWARLGAFLLERLTETDAEKADRLITRSQRLLEEAQRLTRHAQRAAAKVDAEFEKRLRLVSGDKETD